MDAYEKIRETLQQFNKQPFQVIAATVTAYDDSSKTVTVTPVDESAEMFGVRIKASVGHNGGIEIVPKVGSIVLVAIIMNNDNAGFIVSYTDVELVKIKTETSIELMGNSFGGLVQIERLIERINRLEDKMKSHQHIAAGSPTTIDPATNPTFNNTERNELENDNVTHG